MCDSSPNVLIRFLHAEIPLLELLPFVTFFLTLAFGEMACLASSNKDSLCQIFRVYRTVPCTLLLPLDYAYEGCYSIMGLSWTKEIRAWIVAGI